MLKMVQVGLSQLKLTVTKTRRKPKRSISRASAPASRQVMSSQIWTAARGSGATPMVATTPDSFDAVLDFYRARGRVVVPPLLPGQAGKGDERQ